MIYIDSRTGSKELFPIFTKGTAALVTLDFGDAMFFGSGPNGTTTIGIERKTIREITSTITDGRLVGHQLPGMISSYDINYLIVEGRWGDDSNGVLCAIRGKYRDPITNGKQRYTSSQIRKFLTTIEVMMGIKVRKTESMVDTVEEIKALHGWWAGKEWEDHTSVRDTIYLGATIPLLRRPNLVEKVASCLPGIGPKRARDVAGRFGSVAEMVLGDVEAYSSIDGIGSKTATSVVDAIWGRKEGK